MPALLLQCGSISDRDYSRNTLSRNPRVNAEGQPAEARSLRTGVTGWDDASIRFQALIEHILIGIEAGCDEEMLLGFGEQDVMIGRLQRKAVRPRRVSDNPVSFTG